VLLIAGAAAAAIVLRPREEVVVAPVDPDMVVIAAGKYTVGSNQGPEIARPAHVVELASFGIDVTEVTVGDYAAFVATGKPAPWTTEPDSLLPVTGVTYQEAQEYCAWRHPEGGRLPTEEEWEAAARGLGGRAFPWGEVWSPTVANTESARRTGPAQVRHFPGGTTPEGVHDLIGNVWEWTSTPIAPYPGGAAIPNLPSGERYNVIRGGAYDTPDRTASPVYRGYISPSAGRADLARTGFRCVMPVRAPGPR
jgi:formylglycine-generating enzyme required for sulfatase activity